MYDLDASATMLEALRASVEEAQEVQTQEEALNYLGKRGTVTGASKVGWCRCIQGAVWVKGRCGLEGGGGRRRSTTWASVGRSRAPARRVMHVG